MSYRHLKGDKGKKRTNSNTNMHGESLESRLHSIKLKNGGKIQGNTDIVKSIRPPVSRLVRLYAFLVYSNTLWFQTAYGTSKSQFL